MPHVLSIPGWHPVRSNQWVGRHWAVKNRLRAEQQEMITLYALSQGVPKATGKRRVKLELFGWGHGGPFPDADAHDKLLLDALKGAGLITDDSARGLVGRVEVEFHRDKKKHTSIVLEDAG